MPVRRFVAGKSPALTWWTNANFTRPSTVFDWQGSRDVAQRDESRTHRHGDALFARGITVHRRQRSSFRADRADGRPGGAGSARPRGRGPSIGGDGGKLLTEALSVRAVTIYVHGSEVVSDGFWRKAAIQ